MRAEPWVRDNFTSNSPERTKLHQRITPPLSGLWSNLLTVTQGFRFAPPWAIGYNVPSALIQRLYFLTLTSYLLEAGNHLRYRD
jgi:hypothetical protein